MAEIAVQGLAELNALLQTLPAKVEVNVLRGAVRAGQTVIANKAKAGAPQKTGALVKSIRVKNNAKANRRGYVRSDVVAGNKAAWYATLLHTGTGAYYAGAGSKSRRKPYTIRAKTANGKEASTGQKRRALRIGGAALVSQVVHPGIHPDDYMRDAAKDLDGPALDAFVAYVNKRLPKELAKAGK